MLAVLWRCFYYLESSLVYYTSKISCFIIMYLKGPILTKLTVPVLNDNCTDKRKHMLQSHISYDDTINNF